MNISIFILYILIIIYIIRYIFKFLKVFNERNSNVLNNIQNISSDIQNKERTGYMNNNYQDDMSLDYYMKSNANPIKERKGKRSRI